MVGTSWRFTLALLIIGGLVLAGARQARGVPAARISEPLTQPDGQIIRAQAFGDERAHGLRTPEGYTILQDPATGYWVYAEQAPDGSLRPSFLVVGRDLPTGLQKGLRAAPSVQFAPSLPAQAAAAGPLLQGVSLAPALGSQPLLVLFVDFTPSVRVGATPSDWSSRLFGATGSVKKYYEEVSYGNFTFSPAAETNTSLSGAINDGIVSVTLPYAHPNTGSNSFVDATRQIVRDALIAADPDVNFAAFDTDGDGTISASELHILVVVAGYEASYGTPCGNSIWAHEWGLYGSVPAPTLDGKVVGESYSMVGEWHCTSSNPPGHQATIGPIVHELGHDLGLPDLYDTDYSSSGIGDWGTMGSGNWNKISLSGDSPAHHDPWSKMFLGWVTPTQVTGETITRSIAPAATTADVYQLLDGTATSGEYFLVENRQKLGFDAALPGAGLLIWHVDTSKADNTEECYPGGPSCATYHYKVAVVQADNNYDLEKGNNDGDAGDPYPGSTNNQDFNDTSAPSSQLYAGTPTGISVSNISASGTLVTTWLSTQPMSILTYTKVGAGAGTLTSTPASIACLGSCTTYFVPDSSVTFTATAGEGSVFEGWGGDCSGTQSTCTLTMTGPRSITATFSLIPELLTVMPAGTGTGTVTSSPAGINCGSSCSQSYPYGSTVSLSAVPASGSLFSGWSGGCSGTGPCVLTLTQARTVTATFTQVPPFTTLTYGILYDFAGGDEAKPEAGLIQAGDGNLYGATSKSSYGTLFRLTLSGSLTNLHTFSGSDGQYPESALVQGSDGNFYGTTNEGGSGLGTVFRLTPSGTFTTLHAFTGSAGAYPQGPLVQASDGNFYGTAYSGGSSGYGTVFQVTPAGAVGTFYAFTGGSAGSRPYAPLVQGSDGNLYGTTSSDASVGTIFRLTLSGTLTTLHTFGGTECGPCFLTQGSDGNFYGTTYTGGASSKGTVFQMTPTGSLVTLYTFTGSGGAYPSAPLIQGSDGDFYGTASSGGTYGYGTIFRITATGNFTVVHAFTGGSGGAYPYAPILEASDGNFYGTTSQGGNASGAGVAFVLRLGFPISIAMNGTGVGTVASDVGGINCGSTCGATFTNGTRVILTATAANGSYFAGWSGGGCSGTDPTCAVSVHGAATVTATFNLGAGYLLSVATTGSSMGSVGSNLGGISCGDACRATLVSGTVVSLTATPSTGGVFREWRGDCTGTGSCQVTMNAAKSVTAVFSKVFTDSTLTAGTTRIKAVHFTDLRSAIDTLRSHNGLGAFVFTDSTLTPGSTPIKRVHVTELRTALAEAYQAAGRTLPTYTDPTIVAGQTVIRATHINELRSSVRALE